MFLKKCSDQQEGSGDMVVKEADLCPEGCRF